MENIILMNEVNKAIYNKLQAGTALSALIAGSANVYHLQPPDDTSMPYVIFNLQGGGNENVTPSPLRNLVYFVRGYSTASAAAAGSIRTEINNLLDKQTLTLTDGWVNFWMQAESEIEGIDNMPNGQKAYMAGDLYRIRLDK